MDTRTLRGYVLLTSWILVTLMLAAREAVSLGTMSPENPVVETNTTLELNCSLPPDYTDTHSAEDIYFFFNNKTYRDEPYVSVLNSQTATLRLENVQRSISGKIAYCYVPDVQNAIGQVKITVGDKPELPRLIECRVFNWKTMTCKWEPEKQNTGIKTDQQLYWTLLLRQPVHWNPCPHPTIDAPECVWKYLDSSNSFMVDMPYHIQLSANNSLGETVSPNFNSIATKYQVKPAKVLTLGLQEPAKIRSIKINWTSPLDPGTISRRVLFKVTWCSRDKRHGETECLTKNTTSNTTLLENLAPYTHYNVSVRSIPIFKLGDSQRKACKVSSLPLSCYEARGFWSEERNITVLTKEDVPAAAPEISEGGFTFSEDRTVVLYWQKVPDYLSNGVITHYQINYTLLDSYTDRGPTSSPTPGSQFKYKVTLMEDHIYEFVIDAKTQEGYNTSLKHQSIIINTMKNAEVKKPNLFSVIRHIDSDANRDAVVLNWTSVEGATGYTVSWCKGSYHECTGEPQWVKLNNDATNYTVHLDLGSFVNYKFGVSVESLMTLPSVNVKRSRRTVDSITVSSGTKWAPCTHEKSKDVLAPTKFEFSAHQEPESLLVEWQHPECKNTGFILYYTIFYCLEDDCESTYPNSVDVSREATSHIIRGLEADQVYKVWIRSAGASGKHSEHKTEKLAKEVTFSGLRLGTKVGITIGAIFVFVVAAIGMIYCCKKTKKGVTTYKHTHPEVPEFTRREDDDDDYIGNPDDEQFFSTTSSGGIWVQNDNIKNQERESKLSDRRRPTLEINDDEGNRVHTYMNGRVGAQQLGGVRFEKKQSMEGSVSSMETLTTPLSLDLSRDNPEELFTPFRNGVGRNRNISGGSNLNPVPESPVEDPDHSYYNSESSSIGSYNKIGFENDPRAHDSTNSSEGDSPLPAGLLCSIEGTNYHTLSSPETSPVRSSPKEGPQLGSGEGGATAAPKPNSPRGKQSPTEPPSEYDVPSMISPYSKVNCVDFPMSDYDSSAGSFASTDTVIDTFKNKKPPPLPQTDEYVSEGFMQTMASNSSLNLSDTSDIAPYSVVGERESTPDSNKDAYLDDEVESDESQPLCLDLDLPHGVNPTPVVTSAADYVQSPPPVLTSSSPNSDTSGYVQAPPNHSAPMNNAYVMAPPTNVHSSGKTDASYVPHTSVNDLNPSSSSHDTGYVQSADISNLCNNNKVGKPCQNGPSSLNGHGDHNQPLQNGTDSSYLPHSMAMGVTLLPVTQSSTDCKLPDGSKNKTSSAFPNTNQTKKQHVSLQEPQNSSQNSGYISPECLDALGSPKSNGIPTDVKVNNVPTTLPQQVNDSYVTIDSLSPSAAGAGAAPTTNGIDDSVSEGSSDQEGDYTNNVGMMTPPQNNGYVAHVTC